MWSYIKKALNSDFINEPLDAKINRVEADTQDIQTKVDRVEADTQDIQTKVDDILSTYKYKKKYVVQSAPSVTSTVYTTIVSVTGKGGRLHDFKMRSTPTNITYKIRVTIDNEIIAWFGIEQNLLNVCLLGITKRASLGQINGSYLNYILGANKDMSKTPSKVGLRTEIDGSTRVESDGHDYLLIEESIIFKNSLLVEIMATGNVTLDTVSVEYETEE